MLRGRPRVADPNEHHPLYKTWLNIRQRVYNSDDPSYPRYGGRGIGLCDRWNDFRLFVQDMGPKPSIRHTVERMDNDGDYEPFNCMWALPVAQAANRRPRTEQKKNSDWRKAMEKFK